MLGSDMVRRTLKQLGENDTSIEQALAGVSVALPMYYQPVEVMTALNQLQRLFVFLTLCLETTASFQLDNSPTYNMLGFFPTWIVPLRVKNGTKKVKPARLTDFAALDAQWTGSVGLTERYATAGVDLLAVHRQSTALLSITYARSPVDLVMTSSPEIPDQYQEALIRGALPLLRIKEGQQEWQKTLGGWSDYMEAVAHSAAYVRARCIEQGYDVQPPELASFDRSMLERLKARSING